MQWIVLQGKKRFGLSGYNSLPVLAYELLELLPLATNFEVVLSNSRTLSRKLARKIGNGKIDGIGRRNLITPNGPSSKNSRYTLLFDEAGRENLVVLDAPKIRESALHFLILYFNEFFKINSTLPLIDSKKIGLVAASLACAIDRYNRNFGITFFSITDDFMNQARDFFLKNRVSYIEYLVLKHFSKCGDLAGELSDFIIDKLDLLFTLPPKHEIYLFLDTLNLWGIQTEGFTLISGLYPNKPLYTLASNKFQRENARMLLHFVKHPDLIKALDSNMIDLEHNNEYESFESYIDSSYRRLDAFVGSLSPEYGWIPELLTLLRISREYEEAVELRQFIFHPKFGTVDNFIKTLSDIFEKGRKDDRIYPEISIIAGYVLILLLRKLLLVDPTKECLERTLALGPEVSDFIVKSHAEIKRKNPDSRFLDYEIPALILTGLVQVSINNKKFDLVENYIIQSEKFGEKYKLPGILVQIYWIRFIFYQDYEALLKVFKLHPQIIYPDFVKENDFEVLFRKVQALIAEGIFEEKNKFQHYLAAIELSKDFPFLVEGVYSEDLFHQRTCHYISQIFYFVEKALSQESMVAVGEELTKAKPYALALESELATKTDPVINFAWKTLLLLDIVKNNGKKFCEFAELINKIPYKSSTNEMFMVKAKNAALYFNDRTSIDPLDILDLQIEERDPWSRLIEKVISINFKATLQDRIKLYSKAILFVEGPTEENVIPAWAKTLGLDFKEYGICVIPLIGASKTKFHLSFWRGLITQAMSVANKKDLLIYVILDQDAKSHGKQAISEGLVLQSNCFILGKGDIEDYYPTDILAEILEEMTGKKPADEDLKGGRVHAINHFLKRNGYYDKWKISVGKKVAELTSAEKIPEEIQNIIKAIAK
ncbi:MAG: TOPRIM nucleotidyl transferase/hydrolase domain-containing protein [Candidatus Bathyarchaeia archaeon]|jgi:hypothetical protein